MPIISENEENMKKYLNKINDSNLKNKYEKFISNRYNNIYISDRIIKNINIKIYF